MMQTVALDLAVTSAFLYGSALPVEVLAPSLHVEFINKGETQGTLSAVDVAASPIDRLH